MGGKSSEVINHFFWINFIWILRNNIRSFLDSNEVDAVVQVFFAVILREQQAEAANKDEVLFFERKLWSLSLTESFDRGTGHELSVAFLWDDDNDGGDDGGDGGGDGVDGVGGVGDDDDDEEEEEADDDNDDVDDDDDDDDEDDDDDVSCFIKSLLGGLLSQPYGTEWLTSFWGGWGDQMQLILWKAFILQRMNSLV